MKLFISLVFTYFVIVEHHHYFDCGILAINITNTSLMNTSTKTTTNRNSHMTSFIILAFCILSFIILCIYAIVHNRQSIQISSRFRPKMNATSFSTDVEQLLERKKREQDTLTINDSNGSGPTMIIQQTSSVSWESNKSKRSF